MVEVLVRIDQIFNSRTARELQSLFDLVDTPDIGIDQDGMARAVFDDCEVGSPLGVRSAQKRIH